MAYSLFSKPGSKHLYFILAAVLVVSPVCVEKAAAQAHPASLPSKSLQPGLATHQNSRNHWSAPKRKYINPKKNDSASVRKNAVNGGSPQE